MSFKNSLDSGKFTLTAEIFPPKGVDLSDAVKKAVQLKGIVNAINVTDNQRAVMRMNPIVLCHKLNHEGIDSILQMSCRDRNSMGLSSDLLAAFALGVRNVLSITGDYPLREGKVLAKPVFELDSVQLLDLIKTLGRGFDIHRTSLSSKPSFFAGAVVNPGSEQPDLQIIKLKKKIDAGAEFIQTQVVYDTEGFKKFREETSGLKAKFLLGVFPLKSFKTAVFMNEKVPGVKVPDGILKRMEGSRSPAEEGVDIAVEIITKLKPYCDGVHFMTMNDVEVVKEIVAKI
ncbi:MAG: methylenetetrahydrofolate reductase [Candidatus Margulisiibacteriota bacterium]